MTKSSQTRAGIPAAVASAAQLLQTNPEGAEAELRRVLATQPAQAEARLLLAVALRAQGKDAEALSTIEALAADRPDWAAVQFELGSARLAAGRADDAIAALERAARLESRLPGLWRALGDAHYLAGHAAAADAAYERHVEAAKHDPLMLKAVNALENGRADITETAARERLKFHPTDVVAMRLLADVCSHTERGYEAEQLLADCVARAPGFAAARFEYAVLLGQHNKAAEVIPHIDKLLESDPHNANYLNVKAIALGRVGEYAEAIACFEHILQFHPREPSVHLYRGHILRVTGRREDAIAAYRKCIAIEPLHGEAYWALADMKNYKFEPGEFETMEHALNHPSLSKDARTNIHFAMGRARDEHGEYEAAFQSYVAGNALMHERAVYDPDNTTGVVRRSIALYTPDFFASRTGLGSDAVGPIFVIGMPRAGSTLVEQILATHSEVEGTMELADIKVLAGTVVKSLGDAGYPDAMVPLDADTLRDLGEQYMARTQGYRKSGKRYFIDKMPNNFLHVGLIHLVLPNAKIIDVRRHPMACGFSNFSQLYAAGQEFSYSLTDMGRIYRDYVELMAHYDRVLPGRVHRIVYENLIADPEPEIRRLLDYCGLPFEEACLRPHENTRAVLTSSSEQVRRPISGESAEHWRHYEPWLGELRAALGSVLDAYPDVPGF